MNLYTHIWLYSDLPVEKIEEVIYSIETKDVCDLRKNELPPGWTYSKRGGDFCCYPYYVEFDLKESDVTQEEAVARVTQLVRRLSQVGCHAVPACDFEDLLPDDVRWEEGNSLIGQ